MLIASGSFLEISVLTFVTIVILNIDVEHKLKDGEIKEQHVDDSDINIDVTLSSVVGSLLIYLDTEP